MTNRVPSDEELLSAAFNNQLTNLYTAIPCVVIAIRNNLEGAIVDIQPTINTKFKSGEIKERPPIYGVPVSFPVSSSAGVLFPIKVGTSGMAIFSMRSIEAWKAGNGTLTTPTTFAKMDKSDACFYPGIQPPAISVNNPSKHSWDHSTDDVVVFNNLTLDTENEFRLKPTGDVVINTLFKVEVNCKDAVINASTTAEVVSPTVTLDATNINFYGNITHNGNYTQNGTMTINGVVVNGHTHPILSGSSAPGPTGGMQ